MAVPTAIFIMDMRKQDYDYLEDVVGLYQHKSRADLLVGTSNGVCSVELDAYEEDFLCEVDKLNTHLKTAGLGVFRIELEL